MSHGATSRANVGVTDGGDGLVLVPLSQAFSLLATGRLFCHSGAMVVPWIAIVLSAFAVAISLYVAIRDRPRLGVLTRNDVNVGGEPSYIWYLTVINYGRHAQDMRLRSWRRRLSPGPPGEAPTSRLDEDLEAQSRVMRRGHLPSQTSSGHIQSRHPSPEKITLRARLILTGTVTTRRYPSARISNSKPGMTCFLKTPRPGFGG